MASTRDGDADDVVRNERDASIMLLALAGREALYVPPVDLSHLHKLQTAAATQLQVVQERLRINMLQTTPSMDRKGVACRLERQTLQDKKKKLEARLLALQAQGRFAAEYPQCFQHAEGGYFR
jgi:hypothetical protein